MNSIQSPTLEPGSPWAVPAPVLFNTWKHHAGAIRHRISEYVRRGELALPAMANELVVIGSKLMDLYVGRFSPAEVGQLVLEKLERAGRLEREPFSVWVESQGGYGMIELEDGSRWVLRVADEGDRYVHLHPGRWVPETRRVRANVLKTAVMTLAHVGVHEGDPFDRELVNQVRSRYLALSPVGRDLESDQGVGEIIGLLRA
jgi:hypothetical protein